MTTAPTIYDGGTVFPYTARFALPIAMLSVAMLSLAITACSQDGAAELPPATLDSSDAAGSAESSGAGLPTEGAAEAPNDQGAPDATTVLRFEDVTASSGVDYVHEAGRTPERLMPEIMGGGVGVVDVNRDGAPDLVFVNGGFIGKPRSDADANRLYLNRGDGSFEDATDEWNLITPSEGYGNGIAAGDVDGDGWTDLFLTGYGGGDILLRNTDSGFEDITPASGINADGGWSTSAGFFDLENDGDLDLWLQRFVDFVPEGAEKCYSNDVHLYCTPNVARGVPDRLLRGVGDGTFTEFGEEAGINEATNLGLALVISDIDLDGDSDVYLANDISRNLLWKNDGAGNMTEEGRISGIAFGSTGLEEAGMGADVTDLENDGDLDIGVANFQDEPTSIYLQGEGSMYSEESDRSGVGMTARNRLSWGIDFFDADNDGDEDLLVANGHLWDNAETFASGVNFAQINSLFENLGNGKLIEVSGAAGSAFAEPDVSRGLAVGDFDGDGRLDFIVANNDAAPMIGQNIMESPGNFVSLWLEGQTANRNALGARVEARISERDGERTIIREVRGSSSYLSISDFRVHVGLGDAEAADVTIHWPGSGEQVIEGLAAGTFYHVVEGEAPEAYVPGEAVIAPR